MAINRFVKAPDWEPWTLPYDLILKAADMTQQRWDTTRAAADKTAEDLFKDVIPIPGSIDDTTNLPAIRSEYNNLRNTLLGDPNINEQSFMMKVNDFATKYRQPLARMKDLYNKYNTDVAARSDFMKKEENASSVLFPNYDPRQVNSLDPTTPWENKINSTRVDQYEPVIDKLYLNSWQNQLTNLGRDAQGGVQTNYAKNMESLYSIAKASGLGYSNSNNFREWVNSGALDNIVVDDVISEVSDGKYFDGRAFGDLNVDEKAQAMIMLSGVKHLTSKGSLTAGRANTSSGGTKENELDVVNPYLPLINSRYINIDDLENMGRSRNSDGSFNIKLTEGSKLTLGLNPVTPEERATLGTYSMVADYMYKTGLATLFDDLQKAKNVASDPTAKTADRQRAQTEEKIKSEQITAKAQELMKDPRTLGVIDILNQFGNITDETGKKKIITSLREVAQEWGNLKSKVQSTLNDKEMVLRDQISKSFGANMSAKVFYDDQTEVIHTGTNKFVPGYVSLGDEDSAFEFLNNINDALVDVDVTDFEGGPDNIEELIAEYPGLFSKKTVTQKVEDEIRETPVLVMNVLTPLNPYDVNTMLTYNRNVGDRGTGETAQKIEEAWTRSAPAVFLMNKQAETSKMFEGYTDSEFKTFLGLRASQIADSNFSPIVKERLLNIIKSPTFDRKSAAELFTATAQFGDDGSGLNEYLDAWLAMKQGVAPEGFNTPTNSEAVSGTVKALKDKIFSKESTAEKDPYKAKNRTGSSAVGKYQILWNEWGDVVKSVTGVKDKEGFLNNSEAQEKFMDYLINDVYTKTLPTLKYNFPDVNKYFTDDQLIRMEHFMGYKNRMLYIDEFETAIAKGKSVDEAHSVAQEIYDKKLNQTRKDNITVKSYLN